MLPSQPDHQPQFECGRSIQEAVWQMQQNCQFTDLSLSCSDGTVPAHKAMLAGVFKLLGIVGQEEELECFIIPGVPVAEVKQALEELYLESEPAKLMNIFCCTPTFIIQNVQLKLGSSLFETYKQCSIFKMF